MQRVAIIDYGSGNLHSAAKAFERASRESNADAEIAVTSDPEVVAAADRIVLPGVGAFADCKKGLLAVSGMREAIEEAVHKKGRPFLGICVGMQLMAERGLEHGVTDGLGWLSGEVRAIEPTNAALKIPHMGWNTLSLNHGSGVGAAVATYPLFQGIPTGPNGLHAYFVHSYHFVSPSRDVVLAETDYGGSVTAMVGRDNIVGTQFHPEKSQSLGLKLIANFLAWRP
jgi:glutamine amidotransferase